MIVYASIGNSDDKLSQEEWSNFVQYFRSEVLEWADTIHGSWFSEPDAPYQNACWCMEFDRIIDAERAMQEAIALRMQYRQDSVAWAVAVTKFV